MTRKKVSFKEVLLSHAYMLEAIINLLEEKGVITKDEVLEMMKKAKRKDDKDIDEGFEVSEN